MLTTVTDDFGMNEIIQFVNQYGVCWVLIALLVQILISVRLKNSVKHEYEIKEANLKAELQIANLRFQHIFSKQADAIVQTYQNLLPLLDATEDYTALMQSSDSKEIKAKLEALNLASSNFFAVYRPNKIYIPKSTAKRLTDFLTIITSIIRKHTMLESMTNLRSQSMDDKIEKYGKEIDELKASVSPLLLELENDFQSVLGVYSAEKGIK